MVTYAEFGTCVDEFELDLLEISSTGVDHKALAQRNDAFFGTRDRSLQHEVVILDDTIMRESAHGSDRLGCRVMFGRGILVVFTRADSIDLLIELSTVVVTVCGALWC